MPALVALALLSGCGDLSRDELDRGVESLSALAAQGELVAGGVARDATKTTYTRVMAKTLGGEAEHEAEKLADATPLPEVEHERDAAVQVAAEIADLFSELQILPLGVIAAVGGFLDIGDLVFNTQAGALYRYDLLWAVALGTLGIAIYAEMCGWVAAVTKKDHGIPWQAVTELAGARIVVAASR